ncbi:MAG TPA: uracil-DNA glycosylase, partial [Hellea balneolensis]|nr:uracil-DNA glycosylase [Hellea balneolensis]
MDNTTPEQDLKAALEASVAWWQDMGVTTAPVPSAPPTKKTAKEPAQKTLGKQRVISQPTQAPTRDDAQQERNTKAQAQAKSAPTLEALKKILEEFDAGALSDHARQIVFARGNPKADIMFIGEAPGREEDKVGLPFVGPAGQLLDKMMAAIGLSEDNAYITNVCNWRPPQNRNPSEDELAMCAPFITRHIELIAPKIIVIVGGVSLQALTGITGIMKTRGRWQELNIGGHIIPA